MEFKTNKLLVGLLCSLCIATTAHADDKVALFMNTVTEEQYVTLSAGQLREDIEQGIRFAIASAGATFSDSRDRFDFNAVGRDAIAKAGVGIGIASLAYADKYGKATVEAVASRVGIQFAVGAINAVSQEYLQVHLQNRWLVRKQVAKWVAFSLANVAGSSWAYWMQPYIEYQLAERFKGMPLNATSSGKRRQLLEITTAESFATQIRTIPIVNDLLKTYKDYDEDRFFITGKANTVYGTPFHYRLIMDSPSYGPGVKTTVLCKYFEGKEADCRATHFL